MTSTRSELSSRSLSHPGGSLPLSPPPPWIDREEAEVPGALSVSGGDPAALRVRRLRLGGAPAAAHPAVRQPREDPGAGHLRPGEARAAAAAEGWGLLYGVGLALNVRSYCVVLAWHLMYALIVWC